MLLSAVQIKAQHRVAVGAVLDALGAGLIAGLQDLHVGLGRVRVGDGPGGKGLVIILNNLGTDAAAIPQRCQQVGHPLLVHAVVVAAVVSIQKVIFLQ